MRFKWIFLCVVLSASVSAVTYRIRGDCAYNGDGSTWSCAASNGATGSLKFPVTEWERGSTYYLAGGTYTMTSSWNLDAPADGTKFITIKHANAADNSGDIGWQSQFADQIVMHSNSYTSLSIGNYYYVDGGIPNGWDSEYGWKIYSVQSSDSKAETLVYLGSHSTIQGVHLVNAGKNIVYSHIRMGIFASAHSTVRYCMFEESSKAVAIYAGSYGDKKDILIEHNFFNNLAQVSGGTHADIIDLYGGPDNITIRYNWFRSCGTGPVDHTMDGDCFTDNIHIYGNIFQNTNDAIGTESSSHPCTARDWLIYNNIFIGSADIGKGYQTTVKCSGWESKNNLFHNVGDGSYVSGCFGDIDFNYYNNVLPNLETADSGSGSIVDDSQTPAQLFADISGGDFHPVADAGYLDTGTSVLFNIDRDGNIRGADGKWDIGAYEYVGGCIPMALSELSVTINSWKDGQKTIEQVMQSIISWKSGCS